MSVQERIRGYQLQETQLQSASTEGEKLTKEGVSVSNANPNDIKPTEAISEAKRLEQQQQSEKG